MLYHKLIMSLTRRNFVQLAGGMNRGHRLHELCQRGAQPADIQRVRRGPGPHEVDEREPVDVLHREEPIGAVAHQLEERHEVGMNDVGECVELVQAAINFK